MTRVLMIDENRALTESVGLQCLEHGDLGDGKPIWATPSREMPKPYARFVTASEMCHWYRATHQWP